MPNIILVKKYYGGRSEKRKYRNWKLKHLAEENTAFNMDERYATSPFHYGYSRNSVYELNFFRKTVCNPKQLFPRGLEMFLFINVVFSKGLQ